jgi:hypothetical protein
MSKAIVTVMPIICLAFDTKAYGFGAGWCMACMFVMGWCANTVWRPR